MKKNRINKQVVAISISFLALLILSSFMHLDYIVLILSFLSLVGIYVCRLIVLYMLDKNNPFSKNWCAVTESFDCSKVLESGKFLKNIHLGDVGLVYFIGSFLYLVFANALGNQRTTVSVFTIPVTLTFLASFASISYQGFVLKTWCKLCLMVACIVWLQMGTIVCYFAITHARIDSFLPIQVKLTLFVYLCLMLLASCWLLIQPYIKRAMEVEGIRRQLTRWKKDEKLFVTILKTQPKANTSFWESEFVLGSSDAPVKLVEAFNLYCPACANQHRHLRKLLADNVGIVKIAYRFKANGGKTDRHAIALSQILNAYFTVNDDHQKQQILDDWYESMDLAQWQKKWQSVSISNNYEDLVQQYKRWFEESQITHTPSLFINGYKFPGPYTISDLKLLVKGLPKYFNHNTIVKQIEI